MDVSVEIGEVVLWRENIYHTQVIVHMSSREGGSRRKLAYISGDLRESLGGSGREREGVALWRQRQELLLSPRLHSDIHNNMYDYVLWRTS